MMSGMASFVREFMATEANFDAPICSACKGCFFQGFEPRTMCGPCERAIPKANARILVARNKREGGYMGKFVRDVRPGHVRTGQDEMATSLKADAKWRRA
jgi:hypothetical protein